MRISKKYALEVLDEIHELLKKSEFEEAKSFMIDLYERKKKKVAFDNLGE